MSIHWYAHHLGDYSKKTQHLSALEHGVYRLLLDHCYACDGKIPDDIKALYRVCRADNHKIRLTVQKILKDFFLTSESDLSETRFWTQKRVLEEIAKHCDISEKRKKAAAIAHANGRTATANSQQPHKLAREDEICREEVLPSGWHTLAERKGIPDEQIYKSWRKFKNKTSQPYRLQNWRGWVERERV